MFLIRFPFYFALSFAILSIPLGKKRVFDHLEDVVSPYTRQVASFSSHWSSKIFKDSKALTNQAMNNIKPQADTVKSSLSSTRSEEKRTFESTEDDYTQEEKELLRKIFNESNE
ncbi:MAG: hypothetical protein CO099_12120 [Bdellovibrio sp. CG_4_9_14_3_um_filter_39_7]|nr:MAG: hypothetical protein CO099_12120 [Bdellovibrio sp. CG_4_9_14_3_um_filter_39_7]